MKSLLLIINYVTAFAWVLIALRLLTFRRRQSRHRWPVRILAWVAINGCFYAAYAFAILDSANVQTAVASCVASLYFATSAMLCRGNLAKMLTVNQPRAGKLNNVFY